MVYTYFMNSALVLPFSKISKGDVALVGGKSANLGEMTRAGFPVPPGFSLTSTAYQKVIDYNHLEDDIRRLLKGLDVHDSKKLQSTSKKVRSLILKADIPPELTKQIFSHYRKLGTSKNPALVAVRSSATAEDLPEASFAGQQESFLNIKGEANLIQAIRSAWASLFTARTIFYRATKGFDHFKVKLAVPIQLMIQSDISGVAFSVNPVNRLKNQIVIEAVWGLGDYIVQGVVTPDHYIVDKTDFTIHSKQVVPQKVMEIYRYPSGVKKAKVKKTLINQSKLTDNQIIKIAKIVNQVHQHYFFPQDIEWAMSNNRFYIVQSRPITTLVNSNQKEGLTTKDLTGLKKILSGQPASPGIASGSTVVIKKASQINTIKQGDVLVAEMTSPDYVPAMKRASGIITDKGGQTSHAAIVSRELGVPAIVGTGNATKIFSKTKKITLDGTTGNIYADIPKQKVKKKVVAKTSSPKDFKGIDPVKTATKVYVNLAEPELAPTVAQRDTDGVGLLRAEFIIAQIGIHPKKLIQDKRSQVFVDKLADSMAIFCQSFGNRPVVYRTTDFKTNEYRNLLGGKYYEPEESNPMIGYRGAYRYLHDEAVFRLEIEAIKKVRNKMGYKNLWVMIPFVRTVNQMIQVKKLLSSYGLVRSPSFKLWMMVEVPSNVILLEDFIKVGIDGVSIGSNDLTMLLLGTDRDNETVAEVFDERDPAVLWALEKIIKTSNRHRITSSICGQAPSTYSDLVQKLVEWGITSVSVSPDAIDRTRDMIKQAEKRLLK